MIGEAVLTPAGAALMIPLAFWMQEGRTAPAGGADGGPTGPAAATGPDAGAAARLALRTRDFWLLSLGFFVCGFHVVFLSTHLPSYLVDHGLDASTGSVALALIGLFNVAGSLAAGWLGGRLPKTLVLGGIYALRALAFVLFLWLPLTPLSVYVFAAVMGVLWLSTVPVTNALVAVMFDVKNLSLLSGIVFVAHQLGSFLGGWLGGLVYDRRGTYDLLWQASIVLSVGAVILHVFIRERPIDVHLRAPAPVA